MKRGMMYDETRSNGKAKRYKKEKSKYYHCKKNEELDKAEETLKDIDALDMALAFLLTDDIAKAEDRGKLRGRILMCATILDGLDHYGKTPELVGLAGWISKMMNRYQRELDCLEGRSTDEIHSD